MFLFKGFRGIIYAVLGTILLSTLWVTSLAILSDRGNATDIITEVGSQVFNPFVAKQGFGVTEAVYTQLEGAAKAHPTQPLSLPLLKVQVLGNEITDKSYTDTVRVIYHHVAASYYDAGTDAVFDIPPELKGVLGNFALFSGAASNIASHSSLIPGAPNITLPSPTQLPVFVQPFFTFVGLTPDTFTSAGHQKIVALLPWFWVASAALLALAFVFGRSDDRLRGIAHSVIHASWPVVVVLIALWILSIIYKGTFAPYVGLLGIISRAFLPIYGGALAAGILGLILLRVLPKLGQHDAPAPEPAPAFAPARTSRSAIDAPISANRPLYGEPPARRPQGAWDQPPAPPQRQTTWDQPQQQNAWDQPQRQTTWEQPPTQQSQQQSPWPPQQRQPNWDQPPQQPPQQQNTWQPPQRQNGWDQPPQGSQ